MSVPDSHRSTEHQQFSPSAVRYIKLGAGGAWESTALAQSTLEWGTALDPHHLAEQGDWDGLRAHYIALGRHAGTATAYTREARDFYTVDEKALWITFHGGHLWWAFAEPGVIDRGATRSAHEAARYRRIVGSWRNTNLQGRELRTVDLSTKLTQLAAYQQTICSVEASDYLLRVIRGEQDQAVAAANDAKIALAATLQPLITHLHQRDFELFTDLLFGAMGWRRCSSIGGTMKDIDLLLELPATSERAVVQVKSKATQQIVDGCADAMRAGWPDARGYFVYHSAPTPLRAPEGGGTQLLDGERLADLAVDHGLAKWLIARAA